MRIAPPGGVNLIALEIRLKSACLSRHSSPAIAPMSGGQQSSISSPRLLARPRNSASTVFNIAKNLDPAGLQNHVTRFDRREVGNIVDEPEQLLRALEDAAGVVELPRIQVAEILIGQDSAKPMTAFNGVRNSCEKLAI